jgi:hypothetical protein
VHITALIARVRRASVKLARAWKRDTLNNDGEEHLCIYSRRYHLATAQDTMAGSERNIFLSLPEHIDLDSILRREVH